MKRIAIALAALVIVAIPFVVRAQDEASPHHSMEMCPVCHNEDMSLSRSKTETCTLCHAKTVHSGAAQHLQADAARVAQGQSKSDSKASLPLTEDGHIWCGTCHLFHDPSFSDPPWLTQGWVPPNTGLAEAVRQGVLAHAEQLTQSSESKAQVTFAQKGTRALRAPVADGSLCRQCHGNLP